MKLLLALALSAFGFSYDALKAASPDKTTKLMTASDFSSWIRDFKSARARVSDCAKLSEYELPYLIGKHRDERFDQASANLYHLPFLRFAGQLDADVSYMGSVAAHSFEKSGCGYWKHANELYELEQRVKAHADAVQQGIYALLEYHRFFSAYSKENREEYANRVFYMDYSAAVKNAEPAFIRKWLASEGQMHRSMMIVAVVENKDERLAPEMRELLKSKLDWERGEAAVYFVLLARPEDAGAMLKLADDPYSGARRSLASYLGAIKDSKHRGVLEKLAQDKDQDVKAAAEKSLAALPRP